jgi:hypothetical protein
MEVSPIADILPMSSIVDNRYLYAIDDIGGMYTIDDLRPGSPLAPGSLKDKGKGQVSLSASLSFTLVSHSDGLSDTPVIQAG